MDLDSLKTLALSSFKTSGTTYLAKRRTPENLNPEFQITVFLDVKSWSLVRLCRYYRRFFKRII
jgi:hypothetical protein